MTTRVVEQVDDWESRPFSGGYRGLHDLSDEEFSGIVTAGPARLCMTKGTAIGVLDGSIDDFEDASGTIYEAPSPALPLLAVMQERNDEVRAQYYTEETPLSEVDRTLTDGNFTGYVELSENVLSGDYYQVYHAGRSMSVAFVGASDQLITDDEAFEKANDEVGIYEVKPTDVEPVEIPEPAGTPEPTDTGTDRADDDDDEQSGDATGGDSGDATSETSTSDEPETSEASGRSGSTGRAEQDQATSNEETTAASAPTQSERGGDDERDRRRSRTRGGSSDRSSADRRERRTGGQRQSKSAEAKARDRNAGAGRTEGANPAGETKRERGQQSTPRTTDDRRNAGQAGRQAAESAQAHQRGGARAEGEAGGDLEIETRSIPSLDPDRTSEPDRDPTPTETGPAKTESPQPKPKQQPQRPPQQPSGRQQSPNAERTQPQQQSAEPSEPRKQGAQPANRGNEPAAPAEIERLEAELDEREAELDRLENELSTVEDERDELAEELESVRAERDELQDRVEQLEHRINELRTEGGGESIADRQRLGPAEAIDGTNLFIRYESKGDATLEDAHKGTAEASAVNGNLEIQHHTQFEADEVAVNGEPFEAFLTDTVQYLFVQWVVRRLPYEIRDTGHESALKDLYDALPKIDRAELNGSISVAYVENGEQTRSQEQFDVVLRDRMGNPLAVANVNESRQPASQGMMESLITASQRVGESKESFAGSFLVTTSFFEPEAMEAAADATGGGLLSRDKRESFVKLSRKDGFHLCLVEARGEKFNLSVPEI